MPRRRTAVEEWRGMPVWARVELTRELSEDAGFYWKESARASVAGYAKDAERDDRRGRARRLAARVLREVAKKGVKRG